MAVFKKSAKVPRGAPRLRVDNEEKRIRFTTSKQKRILTSTIYDISETGISFMCPKRLVPPIDEVIMMEFTPLGSMQMACMGRVVRTETPKSYVGWENFPETVKVCLEYHHLPPQYKKMISTSLKEAFSQRNMPQKREVLDVTPSVGLGWFAQNWQSLIATAVLLAGAVGLALMVWDGSRERKPASPEWSKNLFEKVKSKDSE